MLTANGAAMLILSVRGQRRHMGLYLRKFQFDQSTAAVTKALTSAVGRRLRVVTLDDAMVAPVGVDRTRLWLSGLGFLGSGGLAALVFLWARAIVTDPSRPAGEDDPLDYVWLTVAFLALAVLIPTALIGAGSFLAGLSAGRFAKRSVNAEAEIAPTAKRIRRISRNIFSPRLVVARVHDDFWKPVVRTLAARAKVVIIDVSHPTEPLLWELATLRELKTTNWVLVGAYEHVAPLADPQASVGDGRPAQLARALASKQVIAYGHSPADHQRFVRALRNRLRRLT